MYPDNSGNHRRRAGRVPGQHRHGIDKITLEHKEQR
jgi:hypothetical protein